MKEDISLIQLLRLLLILCSGMILSFDCAVGAIEMVNLIREIEKLFKYYP